MTTTQTETITWRRGGRGETTYVSADGRYTINHEEGWSMCENAHPMRGGYCGGGEDHLYMFWQLQGPDDQKIDAGATLRQMKDSAEHHARTGR